MRSAAEFLRSSLLAFATLLAVVFACTLSTRAEAAQNLLAGRSPSRVQGVSNVKVLTDGVRANEGEEWNSTAAAVFESERSYVEFDLGQVTPIVAAYLQGDNNDDYVVTVSADRASFTPLWNSGPRGEPGLRERWSDSLTGNGRYVRLVVRGGDRAYSATELQLFSTRPASMPPTLERVSGQSQAAHVRTSLLYMAAGFAFLLFATHAASTTGWLALCGLIVIGGLSFAYDAVTSAWPLALREVACVRSVAGAIAAIALVRRAIPGKRFPAHRWAITASLAASALIASATFYNLGRAQFWNHAEGRPEFVHTYDMRVYQPFAKYFAELQYDGVYPASVLAFAEDKRGGSLEAIGQTEVRGLKDHRVRRVSEITEEIQSVRRRFTDERWADLKKDMLYFEDVMGPEFLGTLTDHGANATPVWVFFARILLAHTPATEGSLTLAGLADGLLLGLMALAMWRSFGLWPMLIAMTVFGANDLYMFGTNWSGATLRHDWLAMLGFGACALKTERWRLAGVSLALAAMIRAFPAAALLGVSLPAIWWVAEYIQRERALPNVKQLLEEHPETVRVIASAIATMLGAFLLTGLLYGFGSWANWWAKVTLLNRDVGVNEISLRALIAGADGNAGRVFQARRVLHAAAVVLCFGTVFVLARRRPLEQAMLLSLPLALVIWNPSNYYSHLVFLLALLGSVTLPKKSSSVATSEAPLAKFMPITLPLHTIALPLLAMCVAGYWSALDQDLERHFQDETVLLFAAFAWLYTQLLKKDPTLKAALNG